jgi:sigma-B regulation protein RsbU (phosphoserine phosphatase)
MAKYMLRSIALEDPAPGPVLTRLNRVLLSQMSEECMFITAIYAVLDPGAGTLQYANAAHPSGLLWRSAEERFDELPTTGGMLGAIPGMKFEQREVDLRPGDVVSLFTDGVVEARTDGAMLEVKGAADVLRGVVDEAPPRIVARLREAAEQASGGQLRDDLAIVVLKAASERVDGAAGE